MLQTMVLTLALAQYNPAGDPNCVAWYRFESGALTTDSTANGNTLTNNGSGIGDATYYKEGSQSAKMAGANYYSIAAGDWSANWPGAGVTHIDKMSTCAWVYFNTLQNCHLWGPHNEDHGPYDLDLGAPTLADNSGASWALELARSQSGGLPNPQDWNIWITMKLHRANGTSSGGGSSNIRGDGKAIVTGRWYHIYQSFDTSTETRYMSIYDATADTEHTFSASYTTTNRLYPLSTVIFTAGAGDVPLDASAWLAGWAIDSGALEYMDGYLDDLLIMDRALNVTEIAEVRNQTFDGPAAGEATPANIKQVMRIGMQ